MRCYAHRRAEMLEGKSTKNGYIALTTLSCFLCMCFGQRPISDAFRGSFVNEMSQLVDFQFSRLSDGSISQGSRPISRIISIAYLYRLEHFPSYHSYQRSFLSTFLNCQHFSLLD